MHAAKFVPVGLKVFWVASSLCGEKAFGIDNVFSTTCAEATRFMRKTIKKAKYLFILYDVEYKEIKIFYKDSIYFATKNISQ